MRFDQTTAVPLRRLFLSVYGQYIYDRGSAARSRAVIQRVVDLLQARTSRARERVLDAGCGTGGYMVGLARAGFQVTGMQTQARSQLAAASAGSVSLRMASLDRPLPFGDAGFDHGVMVSVLQAVANPRFTLGELWRARAGRDARRRPLPQAAAPRSVAAGRGQGPAGRLGCAGARRLRDGGREVVGGTGRRNALLER